MRMTTPEKKELDQRLTTRQPFFEHGVRSVYCDETTLETDTSVDDALSTSR